MVGVNCCPVAAEIWQTFCLQGLPVFTFYDPSIISYRKHFFKLLFYIPSHICWWNISVDKFSQVASYPCSAASATSLLIFLHFLLIAFSSNTITNFKGSPDAFSQHSGSVKFTYSFRQHPLLWALPWIDHEWFSVQFDSQPASLNSIRCLASWKLTSRIENLSIVWFQVA